jgi:Family of unknown function (DUF6510)
VNQTPEFLDGNAAAGDLARIFAADMTQVTGPCLGCGQQVVVAEAHAFLGGPGWVLRCPGCDSVLLRVVNSGERAWLETSGLGYLEFRNGS